MNFLFRNLVESHKDLKMCREIRIWMSFKLEIIYAITVLTLLSCNGRNSEIVIIKNENAKLQEKVDILLERVAQSNYLKDHAQVHLPNTELHTITSVNNGHSYLIKVYLPRGYEKGSATYPVLYVTDAETNFGGITYIVQRLIKDQLIPPMIVVGIAYGTDYESFYSLRSRDLTPWEDTLSVMGRGPFPDPTGEADSFIDFVSEELFPFVNKHYRIKPAKRALYGHSYGGLFGTYVLLFKTGLFNKYLLLSPSLWFTNDRMLQEIEQVDVQFNNTKLYMASGDLEGSIDDLQIQFEAKLNQRQFEDLEYKIELMENETHRSIFGRGFTNGMRYLYDNF